MKIGTRAKTTYAVVIAAAGHKTMFKKYRQPATARAVACALRHFGAAATVERREPKVVVSVIPMTSIGTFRNPGPAGVAAIAAAGTA